MATDALATEATGRVPDDVRRRALLVTALAGSVVGLALWPLGLSGLWALVSVAAFLAGVSDIGGG